MAQADYLEPEPVDTSGAIATCLSCGGETRIRYHLPHLWHQRLGSQSYDIRWCEHCDFAFLLPRPGTNELARFMRDSREMSRDRPDVAPPQIGFLERLRVHLAWRASSVGLNSMLTARRIQEFAGGRFVSICFFGHGREDMMLELQDSGHRVVGIEIDESTRDRARARGLVVHDSSVENLPAAILSESFDIVVMTGVLQGCSDPRRALQGVHQILKTGGHLMADVPNNGAYSARRLGPAWYHCDAGNSLNFFSRRSLARFVEASGFEIVGYFYSNYTGQFRNSRLEIEQKIWDRLYANTDPGSLRLPKRKSRWDLWRGLLGSMFRSPENKYEMIGVIAKKPGGQEHLAVV